MYTKIAIILSIIMLIMLGLAIIYALCKAASLSDEANAHNEELLQKKLQELDQEKRS